MKKYRSGARELHRECEANHQRRKDDACRRADHDVHRPLHGRAEPELRVAAGRPDEREVVDFRGGDVHTGQVRTVGHQLHFDQEIVELLVDARQFAVAGQRQGDEDVIGVGALYHLRVRRSTRGAGSSVGSLARLIDEADRFETGPAIGACAMVSAACWPCVRNRR